MSPTFCPHKGLYSNPQKNWLPLNINIWIFPNIKYTIENFADVMNGYDIMPQCSQLDTALIYAAKPKSVKKFNTSHSVPCHQPVLFPKSEYSHRSVVGHLFG